MTYQYRELSNGIRVVYASSQSKVSHLGVYLNAGSRDEQPHELGIAHFIEHMAFKGTTRRKSFHILSRLDTVGGEMNAFTTKEHTCLYASFLQGYEARAIELFSDIILHSTFPEKEMEKEKTIILDEINSYKDAPSEAIFDDFETLIYPDHPIGRNILGTPESLKQIKKQQIIRFIQRNYSAQEMVIAYSGNLPIEKLVRLLTRYFLPMLRHPLDRKRLPVGQIIPAYLQVEKDTYQTHAMIGSPAYSIFHPKKHVMYLLNNLLGGPGSNSRLNLALRERRGYTYHVESNFQPYSDTGYFSIYLGTTSNDPSGTIQMAFKELDKLRKESLGGLQLHRAKAQLSGQIALSYESKLSEMLSIGKRVLYSPTAATLDEIISAVETVTVAEIQEVANEIFNPRNFSTLIYQAGQHETN
jgi:predicted Zn-dependent peptidase